MFRYQRGSATTTSGIPKCCAASRTSFSTSAPNSRLRPTASTKACIKMGAGEVKQLEEEMDRMEKDLQPLKSFTLPGGGVLNAFSIRRAPYAAAPSECLGSKREEKSAISNNYLNRLSDHFFVQSRWIAKRLDEPEFLWDRGLRIPSRAPRAWHQRKAVAQSGSKRSQKTDESVLPNWKVRWQLTDLTFVRPKSARWQISFTSSAIPKRARPR